MKRNSRTVAAVLLALGMSISAGFMFGADTKKVKLEFFTAKQEAVDTWNKLIVMFQKENPGIEINQVFLPNSDTVIMTRIVKNTMPDISAMNGNATSGEMARSGAIADLSKEPFMADIQKPYIDMINRIADVPGSFGAPYSANANTVLYNKKLFKDLGLSIPKTWKEFVALCEKIQAKGKLPLYLGYKDSWTVMVPWNSLAANLQGDDFTTLRRANKTSFAERYKDVAEKMLTILKYGQQDKMGIDYPQSCISFANGESVMLVQGIWAIPAIKQANSNINVGVFNLPVLDDPEKNRLISGVDSVLAISASTKYPAEARKFVSFLLRKDISQIYINEQKLFSTVKGVYQDDPAMNDIKDFFQKGRITSFADHYYPNGMQVPNLIVEYLINQDKDTFLKKLDEEWNKVAARK